ncbi:hypothetical protein SAMN05660653_01464 [Desulfonatronum thiosulfatophilum]|uniref:Uncharacterized protein n=1 Tax=Desulfonatronum thiosulfatophilum TaxID=617002 RepID=A0A1G6CBD9_9BACT|nr:ABC transporter substrate-binding protein [Desulfonatronum thiosulfatophilum]SDB30217.1 hypothetical protein SAMN05660653_01464 [Desulfonatronum thiosulfatophilum]
MILRHIASLLLLCMFFLVLLGGCVEKKRLPPVAPPVATTVESLVLQADRAWQAGDYQRSKQLYELLVSEPLDTSLQSLAWERLAVSSLRTGDYARSQDALIRAALHDPTLRQQWIWHEYRVKALLGMGRGDAAEEYLRQLMAQPETPWSLRSSAGVRLSEIYREFRDYDALSSLFSTLYDLAPDEGARAEVERIAVRIAREIPDRALEHLTGLVLPGDVALFPNAVFLWEQRRREVTESPEAWPQVRMTLNRLLQQGDWADVDPFAAELEDLDEQFGLPGVCVGLMVPLDGVLAETGWKIVRGAEAGRNALLEDGMTLRLEIINSQAQDVLDTLATMAPECAIVGGPVQRETWDRIQAAGLAAHRNFFTFLPTMGEEQEGSLAWRFFGSPRDQVHALADLAINEMGIHDMAVLFPQDRFGEHMGEAFTAEVSNLGGRVRGYRSYQPGEHATWGESVAGLLGVQAQVRRGRNEEARMPNPPFQAIFIPDSLRNAEMLLPQFFYYDEQRLLILGPEIWSQSWIRRAEQMEQQYFRLAVMPGGWWPENPSPATRELTRLAEESGQPVDFWVALGYDFIRMSSRLGHTSRVLPPERLNALLWEAADFEWSMAPLFWDEQGRARQSMFLFQPTSRGLTIMDPVALRNQIDRIRMRFSR